MTGQVPASVEHWSSRQTNYRSLLGQFVAEFLSCAEDRQRTGAPSSRGPRTWGLLKNPTVAPPIKPRAGAMTRSVDFFNQPSNSGLLPSYLTLPTNLVSVNCTT